MQLRGIMRLAKEAAPASGSRPAWDKVIAWVFLATALGLAAASLIIAAVTPAGARVETAASQGAESQRLAEIHRALGLIEYVIGDYPDAVGSHGEILDSAEYEEQRAILSEVRDILAPEPRRAVSVLRGASTVRQPVDLMLLRNMASAQRLVSRHAPAPEVQDVLRALWRDVVEVHELRLSPAEMPSLEQGAALYTQACAACHGSDGRGQTEVGLRLTPPPADLLDARFDETLSPARVFNAVTFGIPGTAMPAYEVLDENERWNLAFYVLAMRQNATTASPCISTTTEPVQESMQPTADELAGLSDAALTYWLQEAGVTDECVAVFRARIRQQLEP